MANASDYEVITFQRKPGLWRASITPRAQRGEIKQGKTMLSILTDDDSASEEDAKKAAIQTIKEIR